MIDVTQDQLNDLVLFEVVRHFNESDRDLLSQEIVQRLSVKVSKTRVELALSELADLKLIHGSYSAYDPTTWHLNPQGYRYIEEKLAQPESFLAKFQRGGVTALESPSAVLNDESLSVEERVEKLEPLLVPAAGRLVPLNHNSESYQRAVSDLDVAVEAIGSSNVLDPQVKEQNLAVLMKGQELLSSKDQLSVGMIKSFTIDRLKSVANSSIEDFIKQVIFMAIISIGALLASAF